jgi:hypothetical protein
MRNFNDKIIVTMPDLMEQMNISDKTIHRMIEEEGETYLIFLMVLKTLKRRVIALSRS